MKWSFSLVVVGCLTAVACGPSISEEQYREYQAESAAAQAGIEPCEIEAPAYGRKAAQQWCDVGPGLFTHVTINAAGPYLVMHLQFSKKGLQAWNTRKVRTLNHFRGVVDRMVEQTDLNTQVTFHDADNQMIGGCSRERSAAESTCGAL